MVMIRPSDGTKLKKNILLFGHYFHHSDIEANEKLKDCVVYNLQEKVRLSCALFWYE